MAFFNSAVEKEEVPRRTVEGQRSIAMPVTGLQEWKVLHEGCRSCSKRDQHAPCMTLAVEIPHGETSYQRIPEAQRPTVASANRIMSKLFLLQNFSQGYVQNGTPYNAGFGSDNGYQAETYTIIAASGSRLTLRGRNPKKIIVGTSRLNPEWPLPDPETGSLARIITSSVPKCLPVGAQVEFGVWSVLSAKSKPIITKIYPPESNDETDVEFDVDVSHDVSSAMEPWDLTYPPPDNSYYQAYIRFEALRPARWLNLQSPVETQFTRALVTFITEANHPLNDTEGNHTRVLWPDMMDGAFSCQLVTETGASTTMSQADCMARLATTESGDGWATTFSLIGLGIGATYARAIITYHPEANASDDYRIPWQSSCSNSQVDPSGSYIHDGTRRCTSVDSTGFATYRANCWKPGSCDGFALGDSKRAYGAARGLEVDDFGDETFWGSLWHREDWILKQTLATYLHFTIDRPGNSGPSIQSLGGGWASGVPSAKAERRQPLFGPKFGLLRQMTDGDGNQRLRLHQGAFFAQPNDYTAQGGADYTYTAGTAPFQGFVAVGTTGFTSKNWPNGDSKTNGFNYYPWRATGNCNIGASWDYGSSGMGDVNQRHANSEVFVTAYTLTTEDSTVSAAARERFA